MNVLLVVESPNKSKKIRGYFPGFNVVATVGHFKDLPPKSMGVEPPNHTPEWVVVDGKQKIVSQLRAAAKAADIIYIATDPDREGEAIAAHVANTLGKSANSKMSRITYSEISKAAIESAITNKSSINWPLVRAQEARRVVDRYVGYLVSSALTNKFKPHGITTYLTAGRVQSVALKLVVERQDEIDNFKSIQHFGVCASLEKTCVKFSSKWKPSLKEGAYQTDKSEANKIAGRSGSLQVTGAVVRPKLVSPPKPLTTSTYVRLMAATLKLTTKDAMAAAQQLFERGLITYHRTDSPVMAKEFAVTLREFAVRYKLPLPPAARVYKAKENAQEGHECLRVTDIDLINPRSAGIDDELLKAVYQLVWKITLESQLADAVDEETVITLENEHKDNFVSRAKAAKEMGWRKAAIQFAVSKETQEATESLSLEYASDEYEEQHGLPELQAGEKLNPLSVDIEIKNTEAPRVHTEKTLVEKLDALGIGRPSTYASTMERIISRGYVMREKNLKLTPSLKGVCISKALDNQFSFMDYDYTASIEEAFDKIAQRKAEFVEVVHGAWLSLTGELSAFKGSPLADNLSSFDEKKIKPKEVMKTLANDSKVEGDKCYKCKTGIVSIKAIKNGKNSGREFAGCSNFPACTGFSWVQ